MKKSRKEFEHDVVDILCSLWDGSDDRSEGPEGRAEAIAELVEELGWIFDD